LQRMKGSPSMATAHPVVARHVLTLMLAVSCLGLLASAAPAASPPAEQTQPAARVTVFRNVRIFNGTGQLSAPSNVLVRGTRIDRISPPAAPIDTNAGTVLIEGGGRTLMPGLIDAHWHAMLVRPPVATLLTADTGYLNLLAGAEATATLLRG